MSSRENLRARMVGAGTWSAIGASLVRGAPGIASVGTTPQRTWRTWKTT